MEFLAGGEEAVGNTGGGEHPVASDFGGGNFAARAAGVKVLGDEGNVIGGLGGEIADKIRRPFAFVVDAGAAEPDVGNGGDDGGGEFFPFGGVGFIGIFFESGAHAGFGFCGLAVWGFLDYRVGAGFLSDGEAVNAVGVTIHDVFGGAGGLGGIAVVEAQAIDDFHSGGAGKGKEAVEVGVGGGVSEVAVGGVAADAEAFDAEGLIKLNEGFVVGAEVADAVGGGEEHGDFKAESVEVAGNLRAGASGGDVGSDAGGGWRRESRSCGEGCRAVNKRY